MNYAELDATIRWQYREEKLALAKGYGYETILEAFIGLNQAYRPDKTCEMMGIKMNALRYILKKAGVLVPKKHRGGKRERATKLNPDVVVRARELWDGESVGMLYLNDMKRTLSVSVSNNCMRAMLRGKAWGDVL